MVLAPSVQGSTAGAPAAQASVSATNADGLGNGCEAILRAQVRNRPRGARADRPDQARSGRARESRARARARRVLTVKSDTPRRRPTWRAERSPPPSKP